MKLALVLIALFVVMVLWGGQNVYLGMRDRSPVEITCADYLAHPPSGVWLKLTECEPDFSRTDVVRGSGGSVDDTYAPVRPRGTTGPARIVFQYDGSPSGNGRVAQGKLRTGWLDDASDEARANMARTMGTSPDFVILQIGSEPHILFGLLSLLVGVGGLSLAVVSLRKPRTRAA